jgi:N-ethylmaleimide reductase
VEKIVEAVHAKGGFIFLQLWHVGRISHSSLHPNGELPVAPSAIPASGGQAFTADFRQVPFETPRALDVAELPGIVAEYRHAAANAKAAGFDGVEIHSANGYLLDQFLQDKTNKRTDEYGGSIENRARLLMEVTDAAIGVWGSERVGVRLSPYGTFSDMGDSQPAALFEYVLKALDGKSVAYAHVLEPRWRDEEVGKEKRETPRTAKIFRSAFHGVLISAGGYTADEAEETIAQGFADAVAFGRLFIANPDLPKRFRLGTDLNSWDRSTFYGGTEAGYTDYPELQLEPSGTL